MSEGINTMFMSCSHTARCAPIPNIQYNRYWGLPENSDTLKKYRLFDTSGYWLRDHLKVYATLYQNKLYFR